MPLMPDPRTAPAAPVAVDAFDATPTPAPAQQPATDAWAAVPDPAPTPAQPQPAARQALFAEDDGYLRDRDAWVEQQMAQHWGGNVLRSPALRDKAQQWANIQHFDETATLNPVNPKFYTQRADLTPQRAYDWLSSAPENISTGPALEKQRDLWRQRYPVARYIKLRDEQANKIADAYVLSEMGKRPLRPCPPSC